MVDGFMQAVRPLEPLVPDSISEAGFTHLYHYDEQTGLFRGLFEFALMTLGSQEGATDQRYTS